MKNTFVVAIDGPAGAGKSTASKLLANRMGFEFLDTGAMYRCVTLAVLQAGLDAADHQQVARLARSLNIRLDGDRVWLDGNDVSEIIRTPDVSKAIGKIADNPQVREHLTALQRIWAEGKQAVTEGRDQGTVVFHDSPCKIFLTASDDERARRRQEELAAKGIEVTFEEVLQQQIDRDAEDRQRPIGGLKKADDAHLLITDGMTLDEVVDAMVVIVESCRPTGSSSEEKTTGGQGRSRTAVESPSS